MKILFLLLTAIIFNVSSVMAQIPTTVEQAGTIALIQTDNFSDPKLNTLTWVLQYQGKDIPLKLAPGQTVYVGQKVQISGKLANGVLQVEKIVDSTGPAPTGQNIVTQPAIMPNQPVIFILVKFLDTVSEPFTQAAVQQQAASATANVQKYFAEASYGKQSLTITVTPWLVAQINKPTTCEYWNVGGAANIAATAAGYDLSKYVNKFYVMPYMSSCGWKGIAYLGSPYLAWANGVNAGWVYSHELGHNFSLHHAGRVSCVGACSVTEYGDMYSTMGNASFGHYNAIQKTRLGWLSVDNSPIAAPAASALYTLTPLEISGGAVYAVKIPTTNPKRTYWIEYRQPIGPFDVGMSGVQLRLSSPFEAASSINSLLFNSGYGYALPVGATYTDSLYKVTVSVMSANAASAVVAVSTGGVPGPVPPPVATATVLSSSSNPLILGSTGTFTATVTGGLTPAGTVNFTNGGVTIAGCSAVALSGTTVKSAICNTSFAALGIYDISASYAGNATNVASTSAVLKQRIITMPETGGKFISTDTTTQGNWKNVYGKDGYLVFADSASPPIYATIFPKGNGQYIYNTLSPETSPRSLQRAITGRIAAVWYSNSSFDIDVNIKDLITRRVALYLLDWSSNTAVSRIDVIDYNTKAVTATYTQANFNSGIYLLWDVKGHVIFRITNVGGTYNGATSSGLFFDTIQ